MTEWTVNASLRKFVMSGNPGVVSIARPYMDTAIDTVLHLRLVYPDGSPWPVHPGAPMQARIWNRKGALAFVVAAEAMRVDDGPGGAIMVALPPGGAQLATSSRAGITLQISGTLVLDDRLDVRHSAFPKLPSPAPAPWPASLPTKFMSWEQTKEYVDSGLSAKVSQQELHSAIQAALGSTELQGLASRPMALEYLPAPAMEWYGSMVLYYGPSSEALTNGHLYKCTMLGDLSYIWTDITPESWLVGQWINHEG